MKQYFISTIVAASLCVSFGVASASASEIFSDNRVTSAVPGVSGQAAADLRLCMSADTVNVSSRAIRACSKAYKASAPHYDIRSDILTRRGLLQLSAGRFDRASRDFNFAAKLDNDNEFAYLGQGYAAMMRQDYAAATAYFEDCTSHKKAAPLAVYGLAMSAELSGDKDKAATLYQQAAQMRPDWKAPKAELARLGRI